MTIVHDDVGRRRFLSQAVMGFGILFGLGALTLRFAQFLIPSQKPKRYEAVLIGPESRVSIGEAVPMATRFWCSEPTRGLRRFPDVARTWDVSCPGTRNVNSLCALVIRACLTERV